MFQSCHLLLLVMNILQNSSENKEFKKGIWDIKMYYELALRNGWADSNMLSPLIDRLPYIIYV